MSLFFSYNNRYTTNNAARYDSFTMRLTDYPIPIGKTLHLSLIGLDYKAHEFEGQLMGYQSGHNVLVALEAKPGQVLLHSGLNVRATVHLGDGILSFDAQIEQVCESPFMHLYLEYPYSVEFEQIRSAIRVAVDTPTEINAHTGLGMTSASIHGYMLDVSTGGARLVVEKELTAMVTKISVGVMLATADLERDMTLTAQIRRQCELSPYHSDCKFAYGVEFIDIGEVDRLFLRSFCQHHILNNNVLLC